MKKLFFIFVLIILYAEILFPQAVDIPLISSDGTCEYQLAVGLDLTATDCIDTQLGESELPPIPPVNIFLIRFMLPVSCGPTFGTFRDYRAPGDPPAFPFTGIIQHRLLWQKSSPELPVDITYDLPPGAMMTITDEFGGIILNLGPFIGQGTATIPGTYPLSSALLQMIYNNIGGEPITGPIFSLYPESLNFGEVAYGQFETLPVTITNMGYQDSLIIYNALSSNPSFTIEPDSFPLILSPAQTQIINVTYIGNVGGTHIDSILFMHNAPDSIGKLNLYATTNDPNPVPTAQVINEIILNDGVTAYDRHLYFGLDSTATDGIDPQLGEVGPLPPFPPPGAFEAQFFLPEDNFSGILSSYSDFRYAVIPYSGQKEWRIAYQPGYGSVINIIWDFPPYMTGILKDIINGTFINVPMADSGSYTVTNPNTFNRLRMLIDFDIETPVELASINAIQIDNKVQLNWTTVTETNNSGFEILRSCLADRQVAQNDNAWKKIGFIPGYGTTTELKSYSLTDEEYYNRNIQISSEAN